MMSKPKNGETLLIYLVVSKKAVSLVLSRKDGPTQLSVYYPIRHLLQAETFHKETSFSRRFARNPASEIPTWKQYVDGPSGEARAGAGILLISPDGRNLNYVLHPEFKVSNNATEYEALLADLRLVQEMKARKIYIYSDLQMVVSQVNGTFTTRE
ncbi:Ribonuclease H [Abeliophyllum distichum]|uniref:Ribonuclease H n=1 Tax=Abeliophyllum distichum TaxID=126358 RepID=A0ABD1U067_9LAMI